jgi:nucleotide-binding universal stress UspA family protein
MSDALPRRIVCGVSCRVAEPEGHIRVAETDRHTTVQAIDLAARSGGSVVFVHVVDWLKDRAAQDGPGIVEAVREELGADFDEISAKAEALGVSCRHEMRLGKPWKEILKVADDERADVIVVSPRRQRQSLGSRIFHGRTATRILKESTYPVWVVEPDCGPPKRILALLDLSPVSPMVVEACRTLSNLYDAELYGLCCLDYPSDISLHRLPQAREAIQHYHREVRVHAREQLERLTAGEDKWKLLLGEDWVARLAQRVIDEKKIDLVVMGGVSKPRLAGALLGTTAQRLLDHVSVSTWVVRPERRGPPPHRDD